MTGFRGIVIYVISGLLVLTSMLGTATAQIGSGPLVKELADAMGEAGTDTAAARHPSVNDQFVAVLLFPGRQLLVVTARYESPSLLYQQLIEKNYRNIYMDLQSASIPESKVFIDDLGANGLTFIPGEGEPYDTFSDASGSTPFDGDWEGRDISQAEYTDSFQDAEVIYVELLRALIAEIQGSS